LRRVDDPAAFDYNLIARGRAGLHRQDSRLAEELPARGWGTHSVGDGTTPERMI
jgi:hypothetical protein